ncbi:MAG: leucyl aminopeptidase [Planctomycetes bacterium]|nr:leucyl aminopeptidase [Planctomycetota bacterium]
MEAILKNVKGAAADRLILLAKGDKDYGGDDDLDTSARGLVRRAIRGGMFRGARGEVFHLLLEKRSATGCLTMLGLGEREKIDGETLRRAFGALARATRRDAPRRASAGDIQLRLADAPSREVLEKVGWEAGVRAMVEGYVLGGYSFDACKSKRKSPGGAPLRLVLGPGAIGTRRQREARAGLRIARAVAEGVRLARDLANTPGNDLYPETLAREARRLARSTSLSCRILGPRELARLSMGAMLGVAQGSAHPPRLIVLEYRPGGRARKTLAIVGKAVTFDSGGISLKPAKGMEEMKFDMAGGAAVLGAMATLARLRPKVRLIGIAAAVENLPGGSAIRPGDVLRSASGKTIEVISTDAEGRLVLADAIHYARRFRPDAVIDIATLTGAVVVALGHAASGLISTDRDLARRILSAADSSGERVWELPLYKEYSSAVRSKVADVKNAAGREAGALTAAAFLAGFADGLSWAHLDIAGTAWTERTAGYLPVGATGVGVRLLTDLALSLAKGRG